MTLWQLVFLGIFGMLISQLLKQAAPSFSVYSSLVTSVILTLAAILYIRPISEMCQEFNGRANLGNIPVIMLKLCAVSVITGLAADICNDVGEGAIGNRINLLGKCAIAAMILPVLKTIIISCEEFLL